MTALDLLLDEIILIIVDFLAIRDIYYLCQTTSRFYRLTFGNNIFWKQRCMKDYGIVTENTNSSRYVYQNILNIWIADCRYNRKFSTETNVRNSFKVKEVTTGENHIVMIDFKDNVWTLGDNEYGQRGLVDVKDETVLTQNLHVTAKQVSAGYNHTAIIDLEHNGWMFGKNSYGQLGITNDYTYIDIPIQITGHKISLISAGEHHTIFIDMNKEMWSFGCNSTGQLGLGDKLHRNYPTMITGFKGKQISAGACHTIVIDLNDNVWSFGFNKFGQLGLSDTKDRKTPTKISGVKAKQISAGHIHTVIIDISDILWSFGSNDSGQLGVGDNSFRTIPTQVMMSVKGKQVSAGIRHTIAIDIDGNIWTFGMFAFNQNLIPKQILNMKGIKLSIKGDLTVIIGSMIKPQQKFIL